VGAFDIQPILDDIFEPAQVILIEVGVLGDMISPQHAAGLVAIHEDSLGPVPLVARVALEIIELPNTPIHLLMSSRIAFQSHGRFDDRQIVIESIRGADLVVTGIDHRSFSSFGIQQG
jgi:hypothetical protein